MGEPSLAVAEQAKILIVDDEAPLRTQLAIRFGIEGFTVIEASGVAEACRLIDQEKPAIILTDIRLMDGSGKDLLEWCQKNLPEDECPVLLCMTGYTDLQPAQAYGHRVSGYFQKPFDLDAMVEACRHFLAQNRLRDQLRDDLARHKESGRTNADAAAVIAHELYNPLMVIRAALQQATEIVAAPASTAVETTRYRAKRALARTDWVVRNLHGIRFLYGPAFDTRDWLTTDPVEVTRRVLDLVLTDEQKQQGREVAIELGGNVSPLQTMPEALEIILANLTRNACQAAWGKAAACTVKVKIEGTTSDTGASVSWTIENGGEGVPMEIMDKLFNAGISAKGGGMGIGLSVSRSLARMLGGDLVLLQREAPTIFQLVLPR